MNKKIFWTTAALLTTASLAPLSASYADSYTESTNAENPVRVNTQAISLDVATTQPPNVVKVGEYQSKAGNQANNTVIARIQPHEVAGQQAATLYVRDIPVLTFFGSSPVATTTTKVATNGNLPNLNKQASVGNDDLQATKTPVWRAAAVAAKLNQLSLDQVDASKITVKWKGESNSATNAVANSPKQTQRDRYIIAVNSEELVEINAETRLPDKTSDLSEDALQATNRIRRLLGNAPPLREVTGKPAPPPKQQKRVRRPKLPQQISFGPVRIRLNGMASWYGPGFHGNRSASGERYNQNALTAAHRSLPFGTKVRVTNTRNGRSVVVRINDRGPHVRGRIIDLSAAAARIVGVMQSGVAPVRVEVLGNQRAVSAK